MSPKELVDNKAYYIGGVVEIVGTGYGSVERFELTDLTLARDGKTAYINIYGTNVVQRVGPSEWCKQKSPSPRPILEWDVTYLRFERLGEEDHLKLRIRAYSRRGRVYFVFFPKGDPDHKDTKSLVSRKN